MNYFSTSDKYDLNIKKKERKANAFAMDAIREAVDGDCATFDQLHELYFLTLSTRLLRAKFFSLPAYTNEELAYMTGCSTGTYLSLIMTRQKTCSREMAEMMSKALTILERAEGMQPIYQPPFPEK